MACTTILVGRKASYDGSTMIARNDDSGSGHFTPKKFVVVPPQEHPAVYRSVLSHVEVELPGSPMRMTGISCRRNSVNMSLQVATASSSDSGASVISNSGRPVSSLPR